MVCGWLFVVVVAGVVVAGGDVGDGGGAVGVGVPLEKRPLTPLAAAGNVLVPNVLRPKPIPCKANGTNATILFSYLNIFKPKLLNALFSFCNLANSLLIKSILS